MGSPGGVPGGSPGGSPGGVPGGVPRGGAPGPGKFPGNFPPPGVSDFRGGPGGVPGGSPGGLPRPISEAVTLGPLITDPTQALTQSIGRSSKHSTLRVDASELAPKHSVDVAT